MTNIASSTRIIFTLMVIGLAATSSSAETLLDCEALQSTLTKLIDGHPAAARTAICLKVIDLKNGDILFDRRGDQLMTPASNLKIYTSACALDVFGPDHQFTTTVRLVGDIDEGTLDGNVVLVGGGAPMTSFADLKRIAKEVVAKNGLQEIKGEVRVDNTRYASPLKGPGWMWDDEPYYFNMSITPLMVAFNVLTVEVEPAIDGQPQARLQPAAKWPPLRLAAANNEQHKLIVSRQPFAEAIEVSGAEHVTETSTHRLTMHDPGKWVAAVFQQLLIEEGAKVAATPNSAASQDPAVIEMKFPGRKLTEILKHFNEESENAIGEVLLHEIAIARGAERPTWSDGARTISDWLVEEAGLDAASFRLVDGSGLSRYNLISADSSTRLIAHMRQHEHADAFFSSLPTYHLESDTEKDNPTANSPKSPKEDNQISRPVRAKGGSMSGVSTCSGVIMTQLEGELAFSYLTNGFVGKSGPQKDLRAAIWRTLIRYQR